MNKNISIVLIGTENSGNIGAVARVMKNFGFERLVLINPLADPHEDAAFGFAMHGDDVLRNAEIHQFNRMENWPEFYQQWLEDYFHNFELVIGTSAKGITYKNITRMPVNLTEFDFSQIFKAKRVALVFGRESTGLTNAELRFLDVLIRIPSHPAYPTLNLSHAVAVFLSYLFFSEPQAAKDENWRDVRLAGSDSKEILVSMISEILPQIPWADHKRFRTLTSFRNILGRALVTEQEFEYLRSFLRKILLVLQKPDLIQNPKKEKKEKKDQKERKD